MKVKKYSYCFLGQIFAASCGIGCSSTPSQQELLGSRDEAIQLKGDEFLDVSLPPDSGAYASGSAAGSLHLTYDEILAPHGTFEKPQDKPTSPPLFGGEQPLHEAESSGKSRVLRYVEQKNPEDKVTVLVKFEDPPFAWHKLDAAKEDEKKRAWGLGVRKQQIESFTKNLRNKISTLEGTSIETFLAAPIVAANLPAKNIPALLDDNSIVDAFLDTFPSSPEIAYTGKQVRTGMRFNIFESGGFRGQSHGRNGGSIRIGIMDDLSLWTGHPGFKRFGCSPVPPYSCGFIFNMFDKVMNCTTLFSCSVWSSPQLNSIPPWNGLETHGLVMSGVMNGTIEAGQDPNYTSTFDRERRSGVISNSEADFYYYALTPTNTTGGGSGSSTLRAIDQIIADNIDVVALPRNYSGFPTESWGWCCNPCSRTCDCQGMNSALANLASQGTLVVKSAGNGGIGATSPNAHECRTTYPAGRSSVLTLGGLDSSEISDSYNSLSMFLEDPNFGSAMGGASIRINGTVREKGMAAIDLSAPAYWHYYYDSASAVDPLYANTFIYPGTSFATSATASAAALLRQAAKANGWDWSGYELMTNMLLMGDGYAAHDQLVSNSALFNASTPPRYCVNKGPLASSRPCGFDMWSGAGRTKMHFPSNNDMGPSGTWGWGSVNGTVFHQQYSTGWSLAPSNPSVSVSQVKVAMMFPESNLDNASDLELEIYNACSGPQQGVVIEYDRSFHHRSRLVMTPSNYTIPLNCWAARVYGAHVTANRGYKFYLAWYWHSQNIVTH
ncbi:MAG: S8 family serine peptidase [Polyangiaceae bacterium]|jgi:hypothetical protein|nr:S8 family serine peptidase [Polyangiaceae bacterium]